MWCFSSFSNSRHDGSNRQCIEVLRPMTARAKSKLGIINIETINTYFSCSSINYKAHIGIIDSATWNEKPSFQGRG